MGPSICRLKMEMIFQSCIGELEAFFVFNAIACHGLSLGLVIAGLIREHSDAVPDEAVPHEPEGL